MGSEMCIRDRNRIVNVVVLECSDVFAKFGGVFVLGVAESCGVISVSWFEVGFCESNECFRGVVVPCDGGFIND